jgi:guanylate kinase
MGRFVILSGPSCVGKGPLHTALKRLRPQLVAPLQTVVLYNSRAPRPGEEDGVDYRFRPREEVEELRDREGFVVMDVRGDLQAVDVAEVGAALKEGDLFYEGNPFVGCELLDLPVEAQKVTAFLSPLSRDELEYLAAPERRVALPKFLADVMRRKLLRRMTKQKGILSQPDLEEVERRCTSAYSEIRLAWRFGHVIPNHDGEDSENWSAFYYPVGDAFRAFHAFVSVLEGCPNGYVETWPEDLVP